jgi:hypothetical protein
MRALVVGNSTLATMYAQRTLIVFCIFGESADISPWPLASAVQYKLPDCLRLHRAQSVTLKASNHVQGTYNEKAIPIRHGHIALIRP